MIATPIIQGTISAGASSITLGSLIFSNSNGVSFGLNGNTITASAVGGPGGGAAISGGTNSQNTGTVNFSNSNGVSFGLNTNGVMTATVKTDYLTTAMLSNAVTISNINLSAGATSANLSAFTFNNGGGVSFGLTNGVVTATVATNYLTTAMQSNAATISNINVSAGATSANLSALTFNNGGGVSFGLTNGIITATVQTNYLTTAMQSQSSSVFAKTGFTSTSTGGSNIVATHDTNGLSMGVPNYLTTAMASNAATISNINVSAGATSANLSAFSFNNGGGVSFGLTNGIITATVATNYQSQGAYLTTARASNDAIGLNTAQSNVTWSVNSSGLSLDARGYAGTGFTGTNATATLNSNGLQLSVQGGGVINQTGPNISAGSDSLFTSGTVTFGNAFNGSFVTSNGSVVYSNAHLTTARASNDAVGLNTAQSNVTWTVNSAGISFNANGYAGTGTSATNASITLDSNGLAISVGAAGGGGITLSEYQPFQLGNNTTFSSLGNSSIYLQKIQPQFAFSFSIIERLASLSFASSTNNASVNYSIQYGIYSRDTGTNNTRMTRMGSSQMDIRAAYSSNSSAAHSVVLGANTFATNSGGTGIFTDLTAGRHIYFPYASSLAGGNEYWIAFNVMSASTISSVPLRIAFLEMTAINNLTWGKIKSNTIQATNASFVDDFDQGVFTVQSAALPATIADNQISNQVSLGKQYIQFDNN